MKFAVDLKSLQDKLRMIDTFISSLSEMDSDPVVLMEAKRLKGGVRKLVFTCANENMYVVADLECNEVGVKGECALPLHYLRALRARKGSVLRAEVDDTTISGVIENPGSRNTKFNLDILVETETVRVMIPERDPNKGFKLSKTWMMAGVLSIDFQPVKDEDAAPIRVDFEKKLLRFSAFDPYRFGHVEIEIDRGNLPVGQHLLLDRDPIMRVMDQVPDESEFELYVGETKYVITAPGFYVEFQKVSEFNMPDEGYDPHTQAMPIVDNIRKTGSAVRIDPDAFAEAISDVSTVSTKSLGAEARMVMTLGKTGIKLEVDNEVGTMTQQAEVVKITSRKHKKAVVDAMLLRELLLLASGDEAVMRFNNTGLIIESSYGSILSCALID